MWDRPPLVTTAYSRLACRDSLIPAVYFNGAALRWQICTTMPDFMWGLRIQIRFLPSHSNCFIPISSPGLSMLVLEKASLSVLGVHWLSKTSWAASLGIIFWPLPLYCYYILLSMWVLGVWTQVLMFSDFMDWAIFLALGWLLIDDNHRQNRPDLLSKFPANSSSPCVVCGLICCNHPRAVTHAESMPTSGSRNRFWIISPFPRDRCADYCLRNCALKFVWSHCTCNSHVHTLRYEYDLGWWPMAWMHHRLWGLFVYLRQKAYTLGHHVREVSIQHAEYLQVPWGSGGEAWYFWSKGENRAFWIFPIHQKTLIPPWDEGDWDESWLIHTEILCVKPNTEDFWLSVRLAGTIVRHGFSDFKVCESY